MYDKRLSNQKWYDENSDMVRCLGCNQWFKKITIKHLKFHGFGSSEEYKEYYGILPRTPLMSKKLLKISQKNGRETKNLKPNKGQFLLNWVRRFGNYNNSKLQKTQEFKQLYKRGIDNRRVYKNICKLNLKGELLMVYNTVTEAANKNSIHDTLIYKCIKGNRKTAGGYLWKAK